jgi:ligand-binding sensor domain-containing protein/signal transduction histidine kinase
MRSVAVRCLFFVLPIAWVAASAAQLPVKTYTTAEGLARNGVECIVQDPRGFLWFCTDEGLSRFDGYTFINYGAEHGLPNRAVTSLLISRRGVYWVGTWAGLFRFDLNSAPPQKFEAVGLGKNGSALHVYALLEDPSGSLWAGTERGLYRLAGGETAWQPVDAGIATDSGGTQHAEALLVDRRGLLWIGGVGSVYVHRPDGRTMQYRDRRFARGTVAAFCEDRNGQIWASDLNALYRLNPDAGPGDPIVSRTYTVTDGLPGNRIAALVQSSDGRFWTGGVGGLGEYVPAQDKFESYTVGQGLSDTNIYSLAEDGEGNLWVGTESMGAMKIARRGFTTYTLGDGLTSTRIASIFLDQAGELCAWNGGQAQKLSLDCFDGKRFTSIRPEYPDTIHYFGWGSNQVGFQDHAGEWWVPTGQALCRFAKTKGARQLAGRAPKAIYTMRDGLAGNDIFRLFEDSRGDIWISKIDTTRALLTRWERATGVFQSYTAADGPKSAPTAFAEDRSGQVWMGLYDGGLAVFRNGRFTLYDGADGVPAGMIVALYVDRAGRLWVASNHGGIGRVDNPTEAKPHFVPYTEAEGLSNNSVFSLTEDQWGRMYACTGHGVDRLDPTTGRIKHYTSADGLSRGEVRLVARDREGALWFQSSGGLSRLIPELEKPAAPPPVLIMGIHVQGVAQPIAEFGQSAVSGLVLRPNQNQLLIDFVGTGFAPGERLRYQYRLEGFDHDWSPPAELRAVNFASLRPGTYMFQVRTVNVEGAVSRRPATVAFSVLAPLWQRRWFLSAAAIALSLLIYSLYRYRLAQLLAVERIRTRIATDLHDDVGSSLSQVAILSEVIRRRIGEGDPEINAPLSRIGAISRELVDSMSDIVWSINPSKDKLYFLTQRMHEFANDVFLARDIQFEFRTSNREREHGIGADVRRQVFLIFKECAHNIIRHAHCTRVEIEVRVEGDGLVLRVRDNGAGFEPFGAMDGHGLASIRDRARRLGGRVEVAADGQGTAVTLEVPHAKMTTTHRAGRGPT